MRFTSDGITVWGPVLTPRYRSNADRSETTCGECEASLDRWSYRRMSDDGNTDDRLCRPCAARLMPEQQARP